jgi:hypothetical protein
MLTRVGFAARGIMYVLIGYLALRSGRSEDGSGALGYLAEGSGKLLLATMALGFLAYGIWRLSEALIDTEGHGSDAKGAAVRTGGAVSGIIHLALAFLSTNLAFGQQGGSGEGTQQGAATALSLPGGALLVGLAGVALVATGLWQIMKAVRADFLRQLDGGAARQPWVMWLGRAGYAARGLVFLIMGWFFVQAGSASDASQAGGMGAVLESLSGGVRMVVALGLLLFGLFSLVEARYRRINDPNVLGRLKGAAQTART